MILDIGGEGRHPTAWNINITRWKTLGSQRGGPIPRLILGRAEALPIQSRVAEMVILERTPLRQESVLECLRVVRHGGILVLRHVPLPDSDRHAVAKQLIPGNWSERQYRIGGCLIQETRFVCPH